jgi:hypothetical protein
MSNFFQNIIGKGDKPVTNLEEDAIFLMLLNGERKSALYSKMLEDGYKKEELKQTMKDMSEKVKEFKKTERGIQVMININKRRIKYGLITLGVGMVLLVALYSFFEEFDPVLGLFALGPGVGGLFWLIRGLVGLVFFRAKSKDKLPKQESSL